MKRVEGCWRWKLPGRRKGERSNRSFLDVVKDEKQLVSVREEDSEDWGRLKQMIRWEERRGRETIITSLPLGNNYSVLIYSISS